MKTLVIGDLHLAGFKQKQFEYLKQLFESVDKVILIGDFWEGYTTSFDQFLKSKWKGLFPVLKSKKTVYLYGNHDRESMMDERIKQFADKAQLRYELDLGDKHLIFEHGDRLIKMPDQKLRLGKLKTIMSKIDTTLERVITKRFGMRHFRTINGRHNSRMKKKLKKELKPNEIFICGHTHSFEFDLKHQYINTGVMRIPGIAQYLLIDGETLTPVQEKY